jgi:hypothetical protein
MGINRFNFRMIPDLTPSIGNPDRPRHEFVLAVVASVYMQALTRYRHDGEEALRPVGETDYVRQVADQYSESKTKVARGIVSYANLLLGKDMAQAHPGAQPLAERVYQTRRARDAYQRRQLRRASGAAVVQGAGRYLYRGFWAESGHV